MTRRRNTRIAILRAPSVPIRRLCLLALLLALPSLAADPGQTTSISPYAKVQPVALNDVRWTTGFWADRLNLCRHQTVPALWSILDGTNYSQFIQNFRIAAGLAEGRHRGASFNDGEVYKWLEGACAMIAAEPDPDLAQHIEDTIAIIAKAQRADGYIHTPILIAERQLTNAPKPFHDPSQFEMYNFGHLMTAACMHHRVTRQTNFLAVACKAADYLESTQPAEDFPHSSICPSHFMGLVDLYRTTRQPRYLELARKLFSSRDSVPGGTDDNQDRIPFDQQTNAVGHAVRANYLYAGAADLFTETGDPHLWKSLDRIWTNVVQQKIYITGGCGALYDGASPDGDPHQKSIARVHQAYGRNYQLPNLTAHNETCANIGNVLWNWRMFLATGEARFVDVAELSLYNSVLSGVGLDGTNFFYVNPLRAVDPMPFPLRWPHTRAPFLSSFCCPPNLTRTLAQIAGCAYAKSPGAVWVNLYGASTLATLLPDGQPVNLTQETEYPWNGRVRLTINQSGAGEWSLNLRIPAWAPAAALRLNSQPLAPAPIPGSYLALRRAWQPGDRVELDLDMPARLLEANPLVEETRNHVALKRGPLVYCLESPDLPSGVRVQNVFLPPQANWLARYNPHLLNGVVILDGPAVARSQPDWDGQLYREFQPAITAPIRLRLIPYFAWANRGHSDMSVWLPLADLK